MAEGFPMNLQKFLLGSFKTKNGGGESSNFFLLEDD